MKKQYLVPGEMHFETARGKLAKHEKVHLFGYNPAVSTTTVEVISFSASYRTPLPNASTTLSVVSTSANDTANGTGARSVILRGRAPDGSRIEEEVATNGLTPVTSQNEFWRLTEAFVSKSGTYASQTAASHAGTITISDGTNTWAIIDSTALFPSSVAAIGAYTVPLGYDAIVESISIHADNNKPMTVMMFKRENSTFTEPYDAMRLIERWDGIAGSSTQPFKGGLYLPPLTDVGFLAKSTSQEGSISVDAELTLIWRGDGI
jgi:hypothetical protein